MTRENMPRKVLGQRGTWRTDAHGFRDFEGDPAKDDTHLVEARGADWHCDGWRVVVRWRDGRLLVGGHGATLDAAIRDARERLADAAGVHEQLVARAEEERA